MALRKVLQALLLVALTGVLSAGSLLFASALKWANELPALDALDALEFTATSLVYARDGSLIGQIVPVIGEDRESTNRIPVALDEVSPAALQAIVAYEDADFFRHYGFDPLGVARAFYEEFFGDADRGGSTITTQVVKNTVLFDLRADRSLERKAKELMLAVELERRLTKSEILQRYINVVFWGGNVYGLRAAAQTYFGKDPGALSLAEGLYLARLIPAPNPRHNDFLGTRASMRVVLDSMVRQGTISAEAADRAWREEIQPRGWSIVYGGDGSVVSAERTGDEVIVQATISTDLSRNVLISVRNFLLERFGDAVVFGQGGLRVTTTIDVQAQRAANQASLEAAVPPGAQLAIVGIDPETGGVLALVGEKLTAEGDVGEFNRATQANRQPGSSFKPIVYAAAIEQGGMHQATLLVDEPATFLTPGQPPYEPANWDNEFSGLLTVREHMNQSRNIPAIKALEAVTADVVAARARELGYDVQPVFALALGAFEATPLQHAAAFGAFANRGEFVEPHLVARVEDAEGNLLFEANPARRQVWSEQTAFVILDLLHGGVIDRDPSPLASRASVPGRWIAGKTGTTNDERDIWFIGATPGLAATVWIGNDDNASLPRTMVNAAGESENVTSSRQPIYVWNQFVDGALQGRPASPDGFPVPEGIVFERVDRLTGALSDVGTSMAFIERGDRDLAGLAQRLLVEIPIDVRTGLRADVTTPFEFLELTSLTVPELEAVLRGEPLERP